MIRNHTIYFLLSIGMLSGCSQIIEIDIPEHEPKLVLNGFIIAGDDDTISQTYHFDSYTNVFTVSRSASAMERNDNVIYYEDAQVEIYENGNLVEVIPEATDESQGWGRETIHYYIPGYIYQPGNTYEIRTSHHDKPDEIRAVQALPAKPQVYDISVRQQQQNEIISFTFDDPPGPNQYLIKVYAANQGSLFQVFFNVIDGGYSPLSFFEEFNPEGGEQYTHQGIIVDDDFDGRSKTIEIRHPEFDNMGQDLDFFVHFISITKDMQRYLRSYYLKVATEGNPFAEPTQIFFNVEGNGYGSVTGGTRTIFKAE